MPDSTQRQMWDGPGGEHLVGMLKPGGRIVFTCWRDLLRNDWIMVPAAALEQVPMPDLGPDGVRLDGAAWLAVGVGV